MDLDPFDIPPFDQSTFRFSIPSGILPSITAVIRLRNRLTELDNVLDLHREFDTSCEGEFLRMLMRRLLGNEPPVQFGCLTDLFLAARYWHMGRQLRVSS